MKRGSLTVVIWISGTRFVRSSPVRDCCWRNTEYSEYGRDCMNWFIARGDDMRTTCVYSEDNLRGI